MKPTTVIATVAIASAFVASSSVSSLFESAVGRRAPAPATSPPPDGYRRIVDDSGVLAVSIPADWAVRTAPAVVDTLDEVSFVPAIDAGPTVEDPVCDGCSSYFAPPTVQVRVFPYEPVGMTPEDDCGDIRVEPYDDGHFVGRREIGGGCDASLDRVLASQPGAVTVDILFISWSADQAPQTPERQTELTQLFDTILSTVEWTGVAYDEALAPFGTPPTDTSASADPAAALPPVDTVDDTPSYIQLWPYPSFRDVPRLGVEPVRGSGCGASGDLGDVIPDGLWAGYLYPATDGTVEMDVACVYEGDAAAQIVADGTATIVDDRDPDFLVVNNNTRRRSLTNDVRYVLWGVPDESGACTPQAVWGMDGFDPGVATQANGALGWVRIEGGAAHWIFFGCDTGFQLGG